MSYRGNTKKVMADAKKIARRLRETDATFTGLQKKYHCSYPIMMRAVLSQMSKREWKEIRRKKLTLGGVKTRFQKGMVSWNKGSHYNPGGRSVETRFKKGHLPVNYKSLETISIRNDNGKQLRWIKIKDSGQCQDRSVPYARHIWEKENGPIPKGRLVVHEDGNSLNDEPNNLVLVDRRGNLALMKKNRPKWKKKAIKSYKKTVRIRHKRKAREAKETAKIREHEMELQRKARRQAERDARAKAMVESGIKELQGPVIVRWECIGCGADFTGKPPWKCPKCEGLRFSKITQRKYAKAG